MTGARTDEIAGRAKAAAGELTDDDRLKREGKAQQAAATLKERAEDAVDAVKDRLTSSHGKD